MLLSAELAAQTKFHNYQPLINRGRVRWLHRGRTQPEFKTSNSLYILLHQQLHHIQQLHPATSAAMHCNVAATIQKVHQLHHSSNRYILPTFYLQTQNISISYSTHKFSHIFHSIEKFVDIHCFRKGG